VLHVPDHIFLERYERALEQCRQLVSQRGSEGRNALISMSEMFPDGYKNIAFMLYMKSARALSESTINNEEKVIEELVDIINYAAFGLAWIQLNREDYSRQVAEASGFRQK
jgi:hypothetical protein